MDAALKKRFNRSPVIARDQENHIKAFAARSHFHAMETVEELVIANQLMHEWMLVAWRLMREAGMGELLGWPQMPDERINELRITGKFVWDQNEERRKDAKWLEKEIASKTNHRKAALDKILRRTTSKASMRGMRIVGNPFKEEIER